MKKHNTPKKTAPARARSNITRWATVGIDLGDRSSHYCILDKDGDKLRESTVAMTVNNLDRIFGPMPRCRVVMEAGTHSPWVSRYFKKLGFDVIVANPRRTRLISTNSNKHDRMDAEELARLGRIDPRMLFPIQHRGEQAQADLTMIRSRAGLVEARTALVNSARGLSKSFGERLPSCDAKQVTADLAQELPPALRAAIEPLLKQTGLLSEGIRDYDERIKQMARDRYPEVELLTAIHGVGTLIALTFILTIDDAGRFRSSRDVGAYLGMRPRRRQSGGRDPQLGISKEGNVYLRQLLVQAAHVMLNPRGADSDLRRWGLKLAARGGRSAKKKACVAVARKLAALMHHLWVNGEVYDPFYYSKRQAAQKAAA